MTPINIKMVRIICSMILAIIAAILSNKHADGWGWFLVTALLIFPFEVYESAYGRRLQPPTMDQDDS